MRCVWLCGRRCGGARSDVRLKFCGCWCPTIFIPYGGCRTMILLIRNAGGKSSAQPIFNRRQSRALAKHFGIYYHDKADFAWHLIIISIGQAWLCRTNFDWGFLRFCVMSNRVFIRIIGVAAMRTFLLDTIEVMSVPRIRPTKNWRASAAGRHYAQSLPQPSRMAEVQTNVTDICRKPVMSGLNLNQDTRRPETQTVTKQCASAEIRGD